VALAAGMMTKPGKIFTLPEIHSNGRIEMLSRRILQAGVSRQRRKEKK
jgi:hypothetical protein